MGFYTQASISLSCSLSLRNRWYWLLIYSFHRVEQQPLCSYLEKIISKNMDLMEKKLTDYIDRQIQALQAHIDDKMVLLADLVQNSKQNKISQAHYDSNEGFSNGERWRYGTPVQVFLRAVTLYKASYLWSYNHKEPQCWWLAFCYCNSPLLYTVSFMKGCKNAWFS